MIQKWKLQNFKSVYNSTSLSMAPLTIFAGANSSGKSTIIQSLLLVMQTIQNPVSSKSVVLNGHIAKFGSIDDIASNGHKTENISLGFVLKPFFDDRQKRSRYYNRRTRKIESIECDFSFSGYKFNDSTSKTDSVQPKLENSNIKIIYLEEGKNIYSETEVSIDSTSKHTSQRVNEYGIDLDTTESNLLRSLEFEIKKPTNLNDFNTMYFVKIPDKLRLAGASFAHFLPQSITGVYDSTELMTQKYFEILMSPKSDHYLDYYFDKEELEQEQLYLNDNVKDIVLTMFNNILTMDSIKEIPQSNIIKFTKNIDILKQEFNIENIKKCYVTVSLSKIIAEEFFRQKDSISKAIKGNKKSKYEIEDFPVSHLTSEYINDFFKNNVKYLGPLRDEPKSVYPLVSNVDSKDVGFKGENTASVLEVYKSQRINYIPTQVFNPSNKIKNIQPKETTLLEAVMDWLGYMGVVDNTTTNVQTSDREKFGHGLKVRTSGSESLHDLTHVGVGVSQILPILVASLLAEPDSTLIFEQPELHLHPRVQTRLADFFVSMLMMKKQCIVETHSEYLINRLRYQIALSTDNAMSDEIKIYFVEKVGAYSHYNPIKINQYGAIENWPKGFFDENEDTIAALLKAGIAKKKGEKQ